MVFSSHFAALFVVTPFGVLLSSTAHTNYPYQLLDRYRVMGSIMASDLRTDEISAPPTNRAADGSASAISIIGQPEKELSTAAANRFLVAEINRIMEENAELKQFKDKYYDLKDKYYGAEKRLAVVRETLKSFRRHQLLSSACLIAGAAGLVAAPNFLGLNSYGWYAFTTISAMLLIVGMASRVDGTSTDINAR